MSRRYGYVGPAEVAEGAESATTGFSVRDPGSLAAWVQELDDCDGESVTVTFVVLVDGEVRVAPRRSEHVDCARGADVIAAGECTLRVRPRVEVAWASNQSTGYCPEPECWRAAREAWRAVGIACPDELSASYVFRRCEGCGERNLVKEGWFECALCGQELPRVWNFG